MALTRQPSRFPYPLVLFLILLLQSFSQFVLNVGSLAWTCYPLYQLLLRPSDGLSPAVPSDAWTVRQSLDADVWNRRSGNRRIRLLLFADGSADHASFGVEQRLVPLLYNGLKVREYDSLNRKVRNYVQVFTVIGLVFLMLCTTVDHDISVGSSHMTPS